MTNSASIRARALKSGTVVFDVRYREAGQSRSIVFPSQRTADAFAKTFRLHGLDVAMRTLPADPSSDVPTVDEYAETYIASKSGLEGKTLDDYRLFMRISISPAMGSLPLTSVTPETIALWVNEQTEEGYAAKTIKNRHGFLSAMMQHADDRGLITRNPCKGTTMPQTEQTEMVFLSPDDFTTLLGFIPERAHPLILLLAATGLRWGEATALRPSDFDVSAGTVRVSRAWKRSQARRWYLGPPKTPRSRRTVSIPDDLIPTLQPLLEPGREWVFQSKTGQPVRQNNFYEGTWNPARRLANGMPAFDQDRKGRPWDGPRKGGVFDIAPAETPLGKMPRIHDLRHTHASWLLNAGVPLPVIQRRLGHESITTTVDRYGHLAADNLAVAARATGVAMAGVLPMLEP